MRKANILCEWCRQPVLVADAHIEHLEEGLTMIADHPHCQYTGSTEYARGASDGHRCAAMVARFYLGRKEGT